MKLHNKSARPHWLGDVMVAPGATETVDDAWKDAYNKSDLEEVVEPEVVEPEVVEPEVVEPEVVEPVKTSKQSKAK